VQELLEPTIRRSREDREMHDILLKKYDEMSKRIEDLEVAIQKSKKRDTVFDQIFTRLNDLVHNFKQNE
jgi:Heat shock factor binding protein 1.